jgi:hypothetical protein
MTLVIEPLDGDIRNKVDGWAPTTAKSKSEFTAEQAIAFLKDGNDWTNSRFLKIIIVVSARPTHRKWPSPLKVVANPHATWFIALRSIIARLPLLRIAQILLFENFDTNCVLGRRALQTL